MKKILRIMSVMLGAIMCLPILAGSFVLVICVGIKYIFDRDYKEYKEYKRELKNKIVEAFNDSWSDIKTYVNEQ